MSFTILYLYYDLLNLYGESGNLKILKNHLTKQGLNVKILYLTIKDDLDFTKYDLIIMSAGTDNNQLVILKHLLKYKRDIIKAIENNKFFLITGNALNLFGKYILTKNQEKIKCLDIFDFVAAQFNERTVNDALFFDKETNDYIIGFQNQNTKLIKEEKYSLFDVIIGDGIFINTKVEGVHFNNFYGTYLIGPILARNPKFTENFVRKLILNKNPNFKFKNFDFKFEIDAYEEYFNLHYNKIPRLKNKKRIKI